MSGTAFLMTLIFSVVFGVLGAIRFDSDEPGLKFGIANFILDFLILLLMNGLIFYFVMPATTTYGMIGVVFYNLLVCLGVGVVCDGAYAFDNDGTLGLGTVVAALFFVVTSLVWIIGHNQGHDAHKAAHLVKVTVEGTSVPPASSTSNMVTVSPDIASANASSSLGTGVAGQNNYNTYFNPGPPAEQYIDGHMQYAVPLHFDGSGNKHKMHGLNPGYLTVSAEDSQADPVQHFGGKYTMKICQDCGQSAEPTRWAYKHGYKRVLDDPTFEVDDQGNPYWTMTVDTPKLGWTFSTPSKVLLINAHTGQISAYDLDKVPDWVDRVYSQKMAADIAGWYGAYIDRGFKGFMTNRSNAGRLKVSGDPVLVYTGDGHPDWRMLLTSHNNDISASKIVIMDAHSGAMRIYTPQRAMKIEDPVTQAFNNGAGVGALGVVKTSHYHASGLTLHVIFGQLTWMATYEPEGTSPSFVGVGFVDAYEPAAGNVAYGTTVTEALQNYLQQLSVEANAKGNSPEAGGQYQTVTGKVATVNTTITTGEEYYYVTLAGDFAHPYVGTVAAVGPAVIRVQPGDTVTIQYRNVGPQETNRTMKSFTDTRVPWKKLGA